MISRYPPVNVRSTWPSGVPTRTVVTGICAARAVAAAAAGVVVPPCAAPSEMSRTAVGGTLPSLARPERPIRVARSTASPRAVPSPGRRSAIAAAASARSVVGGRATVARVPNETIPTRNFFGTCARNTVAAACAACSRVGATSFASIERDVSTASTTVASSLFTVTVAWGRATPTTRVASPTSRIARGRWRRRPGERSTTFGRSARLEKRTARRARRRSTSA